MIDPRISTERFDGAAIWQTLTAEQRDEIGAAALELVVAWFGLEEIDDGPRQSPLGRATDAAVHAADRALQEAFVAAVDRRELTDGEDRTKLPSRLGPVCRSCGCSENDACDESCGWAEPDLCTACVGKAVA